MDDRETLPFAMDCAPNDSPMSNLPGVNVADLSLPDELEPAPPVGDPEHAALNMSADAPSAPEITASQTLEALLFSSDTPLSAARLAELVGSATPAAVRKHIDALNEKYQRAGLSFRIEAIARGYQMMTLPDFRPWIEKLNKQRSETRLTQAALETLSIVAYKQPIIRADVEAIRGVACGEVIVRLRDTGLLRVLGRAEVVGRPLLYGTTRRFLEVFGLADLDDLPPMEALRLKSASKPVEEVQPIKPPPIPQPSLPQCAVVGA